MTRFLLVGLIFAGVLVVCAMADGLEGQEQNSPKIEEHGVGWSSDPPEASSENGSISEIAEAPESRRMGKHHSSGKSVAGGGVIIGGLATASFAAIFCYIRATRKNNGDC
ncbi:hypothetical protein HHK36_003462 [Tetracentron sinense]|uniref:Uncharacterized protein n=1 Tax=Tetracentron sinense TaxID=13715 RepID=A0A834ZSK0_TETSI|nr:hypothetical protein HHK36_003462 [Tetracentron sinense]